MNNSFYNKVFASVWNTRINKIKLTYFQNQVKNMDLTINELNKYNQQKFIFYPDSKTFQKKIEDDKLSIQLLITNIRYDIISSESLINKNDTVNFRNIVEKDIDNMLEKQLAPTNQFILNLMKNWN